MIEDRLTRSPMETYAEYLAKGQLAYQFSPAAGRAVFYPRIVCPFTGSDALEWRISSGRGTVHSLTVVSRKGAADHCVVLVDLDEGFRMLSRVDGMPAAEVAIGMRVEVRIARTDPDWTSPHPTFVLSETAHAA